MPALRRKGRKGLFIMDQTAMWILGIMGFIIILGFIFYINFEKYGEDEVCKLSVITKATSPDEAQSLLPLKCSTNKICLTDGKGDCKESFAGLPENEINKVTLPSDRTRAARIIEEQSAEAMYQCWRTMGEGKLDLFGSYLKSRGLTSSSVARPICVICSRIAVDKNVKEDVLKEVNIYRYMKENNVPNTGITYLQAFTDKSFQAYPVIDSKLFNDKLGSKEAFNDGVKFLGSGREIAMLFMQIKAPKVSEVLNNFAKDTFLLAGGAFLTPAVIGAPGASKALFLKVAGSKLGIYTAAVAVGLAGQSAINAYSGQLMASGYCGQFSTNNAGTGREGCSLVEAVPYDFRAINQICDDFEGSQ